MRQKRQCGDLVEGVRVHRDEESWRAAEAIVVIGEKSGACDVRGVIFLFFRLLYMTFLPKLGTCR